MAHRTNAAKQPIGLGAVRLRVAQAQNYNGKAPVERFEINEANRAQRHNVNLDPKPEGGSR
jgi:hypothetical protein